MPSVIKITYYGHSCFRVMVKSRALMFDPFISGNELAKSIDINYLNADYLLISHGHEDHIADALAIGKRTGAKVVSNYEIITWLASKGLTNGHPMNHGGQCDFNFGTVKFVNGLGYART